MSDQLRTLLAAIDHSLRTGSRMTGGNLALEYLCLRLGVDRDTLEFEPGWAQRMPEPGQCICGPPVPLRCLACPVHGFDGYIGEQGL